MMMPTRRSTFTMIALGVASLCLAGEPSVEETAVDSSLPTASKRTGYEIFYSQTYRTYEYKGETRKLRGDLYRPTGESIGQPDQPLPTVLLLHGGAWRGGSKVQMLLHSKKLAKRGYASFAINYRLAPRHKFPAQIHDAKAAVRWLRRNADKFNLDPDRIAAYGYSAGGHLACLLGTTDATSGLEGPLDDGEIAQGHSVSTRVQVVVGGGAPCDFRPFPPDEEFLVYWLGGTRRQQPKRYQLASPASHISNDDPPMFFFHGEKDWLVPSHNPSAMKKQLADIGVRAEMHICPGKGHVNTFADDPSIQASIDFLDSVLKPKQDN